MSAMKICTLLFTLFLAVLCGCGHWLFTDGHGDVGQFILQNAEHFGGTPTATNGLPRISDQWRYFKGSNRVVIDLSPQKFPAVEAFLRQSFGQPTGYGNKYYYYQLSTNGGSLYLLGSDKSTEVIIQWHPMPTLSMMLPNNQTSRKFPLLVSQD
jgi:hypothetical protein